MSMSQKHYESVAAIVRRVADEHPPLSDDAWETMDSEQVGREAEARDTANTIADGLANLFAGESARFDRERFLTACGFGA